MDDWWDYTDHEIDAMSLDELWSACERAEAELGPRPPTVKLDITIEDFLRTEPKAPTVLSASQLAERQAEERLETRYVRLRDAYFDRRFPR
jgi:hypothetical protein